MNLCQCQLPHMVVCLDAPLAGQKWDTRTFPIQSIKLLDKY